LPRKVQLKFTRSTNFEFFFFHFTKISPIFGVFCSRFGREGTHILRVCTEYKKINLRIVSLNVFKSLKVFMKAEMFYFSNVKRKKSFSSACNDRLEKNLNLNFKCFFILIYVSLPILDTQGIVFCNF
jgi:hypothetical protein